MPSHLKTHTHIYTIERVQRTFDWNPSSGLNPGPRSSKAAVLRLQLQAPLYRLHPWWKNVQTRFPPSIFHFKYYLHHWVPSLSLSLTSFCLHVLWDRNGISLHMNMECWYLLCFKCWLGVVRFTSRLIYLWHFVWAAVAGARSLAVALLLYKTHLSNNLLMVIEACVRRWGTFLNPTQDLHQCLFYANDNANHFGLSSV